MLGKYVGNARTCDTRTRGCLSSIRWWRMCSWCIKGIVNAVLHLHAGTPGMRHGNSGSVRLFLNKQQNYLVIELLPSLVFCLPTCAGSLKNKFARVLHFRIIIIEGEPPLPLRTCYEKSLPLQNSNGIACKDCFSSKNGSGSCSIESFNCFPEYI